MALKRLLFRLAHFSWDMKNTISVVRDGSQIKAEALAPFIPRNFWSSYEYFIRSPKEGSCAH